MDRSEHLAWCKKRALEYLDQGDIQNALTSMMSDLGKHPETEVGQGSPISRIFMFECMNPTADGARRFITGFN